MNPKHKALLMRAFDIPFAEAYALIFGTTVVYAKRRNLETGLAARHTFLFFKDQAG